MDSNIDLLATLEAKSRQTSLAALAKRGKKSVRVIRAKDVAWMVQEAVERALADSHWVPPEQVDEVRRRAQQEFESLKRERSEEQRVAVERQQALEQLIQEREEREQEITVLQRELAELRARELEAGESRRPSSDHAGDGTSALLLMRLMEEVATLKSQVGAPSAGQAAPSNLDSALEQKLAALVGSLDDRLDKLGRKMGVSSAVEADVDFDSLVKRTVDTGQQMESNMDTVEVNKRTGAGIAANLERMRKLKGGK